MAEETELENVVANPENQYLYMMGRGQVPVYIVLKYVKKGDHVVLIGANGSLIGGIVEEIDSTKIVLQAFGVHNPVPHKVDDVRAIILNDPDFLTIVRDTKETT
ncbi:MAG: hypothetical protein G01um101448_309 [Parcubacteria group bacterium Gr01-1014_48]|nr:MAG: hypothetical protein Greene041614_481 [Parcubacteria group bacterium Greene0416_14]TSC74146.1 MAG: hypothetical protein G01um101448_309 [Parcubacteria group bacterium Gr01-1014_48]TSD01697.1 MAG: hypothetical protein Greene101415_95 [Parcubacteria group bacterium Greene1014_15]TSD08169.1 MAG: hypothetical protein Greene07144_351 [Parcubacteria group bacterium Greene0714_4]